VQGLGVGGGARWVVGLLVPFPCRAIVAVSTPRVKVRHGGWAWRPGGCSTLTRCAPPAHSAAIGKGSSLAPPFGRTPARQWWSPIEPNAPGVRARGRSCERLLLH